MSGTQQLKVQIDSNTESSLEISVLKNIVLKSKILAGLFGMIIIIQTVAITYFLINGNILDNIPPERFIWGPLFILIAMLCELYASRIYAQKIKTLESPKEYLYFLQCFLEISFPSFIILSAHIATRDLSILGPNELLNSPPVLVYFIMILLTALSLNQKLSIFTGIIGGLQYLLLVLFLSDKNGDDIIDVNFMIRSLFMVFTGIVTGIISNKIREAVKSSLSSKDLLINKLDFMVKEKTREISESKDLIQIKNHLLNEKNKDITDSINYAKRIQEALLNGNHNLEESLSNFIVFFPKDIVSGDFYWIQKDPNDPECILIAAGDCTGHGVPGAFMSLMAINFLNNIVNEKKASRPDFILNQLREEIILALNPHGSTEYRDGLDIAFCRINTTKKFIDFAGANNPLLHVRNGIMNIIKADKFPVGIYPEKKDFNLVSIDIETGDQFYLFSDGFQDQFGGEKGKKFKISQLKELLVEIREYSMSEQKETLLDALKKWMNPGNGEKFDQVDDILLIGFKV